MITFPMIFMITVTMTALVLLIQKNLVAGNLILVVFPIALFILAIFLAVEGYQILFGNKAVQHKK